MLDNKKVLITGGGGMIGRSLVNLLLEKNAIVHVVDLSDPINLDQRVIVFKKDLRHFQNCLDVCKGMDYVFHLAGVKGSPKMCIEQPVDFMVPMLQFNTNMMEAAFKSNVKWYLYTSSVGVYSPAEVFYEDDVWKTFPSPNDRYAGWAKRIGELQSETYRIQYNWNRISIVRPANVYGPFDNFNPSNAMVVPSLIRKAQENDVLEVYGDGSQIRDFIFADDVAKGMLLAVENQITDPINLGSGMGFKIKELVEMVVKHSNRNVDIKWLTDVPGGDKIRLFDTNRAKSYGFNCETSLDEGIRITTEWYLNNKQILDKRYNPFVNH